MIRGISFAAVCLIAAAFAQPDKAVFSGQSWWNHVKVLADDNMQGRETGSEGLRKAEAYVVDQLKRDGVQAAGSDGYYQQIPFVERQIVERECSLAVVREGGQEKLDLGEDAILSTRAELAPSLEAGLVFVGYGLSIPERSYNDLSGLDLAHKVAVVFSGAPQNLPPPLAAHAQSAGERWKALHQAGAVGLITIPNPDAMDIPWSRMSLNRAHPGISLRDAEFDETPGQQLAVTLNPAHADKLFSGSGHSFQEILDAHRAHKPLPKFPLRGSIVSKTKVETKPVTSANVVGVIQGADPQLRNEYVVISAHIDHLGIGEPINGDRIYNGAMDNASGCAALLDIAASVARSAHKPKRSLLMLWVTGEEKGLLGSKYFAAHPTVPLSNIVADINMDMFLPIVPLKILTVYGLSESTLGNLVRRVASSEEVRIQADPEPQRNVFIRSDQYSFIRHGIPSIAMKVGFSPEQRPIEQAWLHTRYHAPSDDLAQPVELEAAGKYEEIVRALAVAIADSPERPEWNRDSFFRRFAASRAG